LAHIVDDKQKLLNRVRRLRGQIEALERALEAEEHCTEVMRLLATARGAISAIMAEVVEGHILLHVARPDRKPSRAEQQSLDELMYVLRTYVR
jgi:DNA-binding FrmR family transcriptional regulator